MTLEYKSKSNWWYVLPFFLGIIGGLISYFIIKNDDPKKASECIWIGIILTLVGISTNIMPTVWTRFLP